MFIALNWIGLNYRSGGKKKTCCTNICVTNKFFSNLLKKETQINNRTFPVNNFTEWYLKMIFSSLRWNVNLAKGEKRGCNYTSTHPCVQRKRDVTMTRRNWIVRNYPFPAHSIHTHTHARVFNNATLLRFHERHENPVKGLTSKPRIS